MWLNFNFFSGSARTASHMREYWHMKCLKYSAASPLCPSLKLQSSFSNVNTACSTHPLTRHCGHCWYLVWLELPRTAHTQREALTALQCGTREACLCMWTSNSHPAPHCAPQNWMSHRGQMKFRSVSFHRDRSALRPVHHRATIWTHQYSSYLSKAKSRHKWG